MSGVTRKIYEHELNDIKSMWNKQIKTIEDILGKHYDEKDIIESLKKYYPHEWYSVQVKYDYYYQKDKHLERITGRRRYNMPSPENLIKSVSEFKKITSYSFRQQHSLSYNIETATQYEILLSKKRQPKINKINKKIAEAKSKTQQVTPDFIDKLIGLYEQKRTSQKDKVYILFELKKYYNVRIIKFFFKVNDTELNKQLRNIAFQHLQSFNYNPRLRKQKYMQVHCKNRTRKEYLKNVYPDEHYDIKGIPQELEYRIHNSKDQKIKRYDYFISHSSKDFLTVQHLISYENSQGKNIYCDWISDSDYLKRHLVCDATLKVIEKRME